jgi:urease accessory protein
MAWHGHLQIDYRRDGERTIALDRHDGPLRVLQRLYPEGERICHHVLVHPPGGMVGGDVLELDLRLAAGCHALVTTPAASRYYRSAGDAARQTVRARLAAGSRLEWLPMETIAYAACDGFSGVEIDLDPGAEAIGWDLLALGLPAANQPFDRGRFEQRLSIRGRWLDHGLIAADDALLQGSPLGLAGHGVLATMWFAAAGALTTAQRAALVDAARSATPAGGSTPAAGVPAAPPAANPDANANAAALIAGTSAVRDDLIVVRVLAGRVEPAFALLVAIWSRWRALAWGLGATPPRIWRT